MGNTDYRDNGDGTVTPIVDVRTQTLNEAIQALKDAKASGASSTLNMAILVLEGLKESK